MSKNLLPTLMVVVDWVLVLGQYFDLVLYSLLQHLGPDIKPGAG